MHPSGNQTSRYLRLLWRHCFRDARINLRERWGATLAAIAVFVIAVVMSWVAYGEAEVVAFVRQEWVLLFATLCVVGISAVFLAQMRMYYELEERVNQPGAVKKTLFRELFRLYTDLERFRTEIGMSAIGSETDRQKLDRLATSWRSKYATRAAPLREFASRYTLGEPDIDLRPSDRYFKSDILHSTLSDVSTSYVRSLPQQ
jgi:hypothetical protein